MNLFEFIFKSRGGSNLVKRTCQVLSRFGTDPGRMGRRFERFMDLLDNYDCRPTFPITALPMNRHPEFAKRLLSRGAELAVHAYTHTDLTALDRETQFENIGKAIQIFRREGIPFVGFRAPYLHWNEDTISVVQAYQFKYSSNRTVLWNVVDLEDMRPEQVIGWEKAREFYQPVDAAETIVLPFRQRGYIEIPVSLPDDEILIDRMYFKDPDLLSTAWGIVLERTYERGEIFTIQLHPERVDFFGDPLENLLSSCRERKGGIWVASLEDVADWWISKNQNNAEFNKENGAYKISVKACKGTTVYLRINGVERMIEPGVIKVESQRRPCVGISPGSDQCVASILRDKGYILEVGEPPEDYAIHLGKIENSTYNGIAGLLGKLEGFEGPILHFGTWPHGNRSAVAVTGDIDALTIWDFLNRLRGA